MIALIQRVKEASCAVKDEITGRIDSGLLIYIGFSKGDQSSMIDSFAQKISKLRVFQDENGKMNKSIMDTTREILLISQFTLSADLSSGNRPSFDNALEKNKAEILYEELIESFKRLSLKVERGIFGAHMELKYTNDGPISFIFERKLAKN